MTAKEMEMMFFKYNFSSFETIIPNIYLDWFACEMDLLCIRKSGYIEEIEIKRTVADFKADFKKTFKKEKKDSNGWGFDVFNKHEELAKGNTSCNRFSFLMPEAIADKCDIPEYAGLFVITERGYLSERKRAPLLHKEKISSEQKFSIVKKFYFRYWDLRKKQK